MTEIQSFSNESRAEFFTALAKAQGEIGAAAKDSENPHYRSKYADLASVWEAVRGPLSKNGLSVIQLPRCLPDFSGVVVRTILSHSGGFAIEHDTQMPVSKQDAHGIGSAITYARRYSLMAVAGVAPDDDDGNAAVGVSSGPSSKSAKTASPKDNDSADKAAKAFVEDAKKFLAGKPNADDLVEWNGKNGAKLKRLRERLPDDAKKLDSMIESAYYHLSVKDDESGANNPE